MLYVHRLPLLSFPSLFLAVTFLFTCSPLILYLLKGSDAFLFWEIVDTQGILKGMPVVMLAFSSSCSVRSCFRPRPRPGDGYRL